MKLRFRSICIVLMLLPLANLVQAQYILKDFIPLRQLEGTWQIEYEDYTLYEVWSVVGQDHLEAESYQVKDGDTIPQETIELRFYENQIVYSPRVFNQNEGQAIPYTLVAIKRGAYAFENKEHDFPTKITYELRDQNDLLVIIEGLYRGGQRRIPFNFKRVH